MHATIADQITDLVQNAIEAGATHIGLTITEKEGKINIGIADNGCGISPNRLTQVWDPFHTDGKKHAGRKVGLGLAFLRQTVEATGGNVTLVSQPGTGATLTIELDARHVDLPPWGDLAGALAGIMAFEGDYELTVERECYGKRYSVTRSELTDALGGLAQASSLAMIKQYIASHEKVFVRKGFDHDSDDP